MRHDQYYIQGGDVIFRVSAVHGLHLLDLQASYLIVECLNRLICLPQVENYLFRVHRYFFVRESPYFRDKLPHPPPPGEHVQGANDHNPFVLEDALSEDFARFLWVFYNPYVYVHLTTRAILPILTSSFNNSNHDTGNTLSTARTLSSGPLSSNSHISGRSPRSRRSLSASSSVSRSTPSQRSSSTTPTPSTDHFLSNPT